MKLAGDVCRDESTYDYAWDYHESPVHLGNNFPVIFRVFDTNRVDYFPINPLALTNAVEQHIGRSDSRKARQLKIPFPAPET